MRPTVRSLRERQAMNMHRLRGLARRMTVGATAANGLWQVLGFNDGTNQERDDDVEVFMGVGYYARPKAGADAEAITLNIGAESGHPVIVATRDKSTQPTLNADECAIANSLAIIHVKDNGQVHVTNRSGGAALQLATKADIDALAGHVNSHVHTGGTLPGSLTGTPNTPAPSAAGTSILRAQ